MEKKILHILTYDFPYIGNDSKFMTDEVKFLSKIFDEIKLYPMKTNNLNIKKLEKNIQVDHTIANEIFNPFNLIVRFFKIFFCRYLWLEIMAISKKNNLKKIKMILIERYIAEIIFITFKKKRVTNDYFYSFWANHNLLGFYLLKKRKLIKKSFSRILGSDFKGFIPYDSFVAFKKIKFSKLDLVLTLNHEQDNALKFKKLMQEQKIHKNYLGINHQRLRYDYQKKIINFASCGRLTHIKNNIEIFKFINFFSNKNPNLTIFFYCVGNGKEKEELLNYAKKYFSKNINFFLIHQVTTLTNFLKRKKINFFLNFSYSEGMSFSVMEALSCSIPVICSKIPGNTEIINNNNGYILDKFDNKNYDLLSKKILYDYISKQRYFKKRKEAFKNVIVKISRKKNQIKLKKILYNFIK